MTYFVKAPGPIPKKIKEQIDKFLDQLMEYDLNEARDLAASKGFEIRVIEKDGQALAVTKDFKKNRINIGIEGNDVIGIAGFG